MPRQKRKITVVVEPLDEAGKVVFQERVNKVYYDMIRWRLANSRLNRKEKEEVLDHLIEFYEKKDI